MLIFLYDNNFKSISCHSYHPSSPRNPHRRSYRPSPRLITKYSGPDWNAKETANRVVDLLIEHRALIQTELNEVNSGARKLTDKDFQPTAAQNDVGLPIVIVIVTDPKVNVSIWY